MNYSCMTDILKKLNNFLKGVAVLMILVSIVTPFAYQMTQVFALDYAVEMHIQYKDGTKQSIFKTEEALLDEPLPEIQAAGEMPEIETVFTPEQYEEIEEEGGVIYDRYLVASIDETKLKELGYTSEQIADIAKMVEWYNSFKVLSVRIIDLRPRKEAKKVSLGVTASAAPCEPEFSYELSNFNMTKTVKMNNCAVAAFKRDTEYLTLMLGVLSATPCGAACGVGAFYYGKMVIDLGNKNDECDQQGAVIVWLVPGVWDVRHIC